MENTAAIIEKVRNLVAPLGASERLALIQAIAAMDLPPAENGENAVHVRRRQLAEEQEGWYGRPLAERRRYSGEYVAVHSGEVVDHDLDQRALYLRVRERFGHAPVLIVHADWEKPPTFTVHSHVL